MPGLSAGRRPTEHAAVVHLLTGPRLAARCAPHLSGGEVDWAAILGEAATMSGGEQLLVRIAFDLWEAKGVVGIWELPRRLDRASFERVLEALELCRSDGEAVGLRRAA